MAENKKSLGELLNPQRGGPTGHMLGDEKLPESPDNEDRAALGAMLQMMEHRPRFQVMQPETWGTPGGPFDMMMRQGIKK